ncbi:MAG: hypothetical protein BVN35_05505 [Proteobacteria bacterium ST_bin11]|nr:MAG: hypothetical protein BVN35_05505 [Proteobacteria bacterium ST_bin11]
MFFLLLSYRFEQPALIALKSCPTPRAVSARQLQMIGSVALEFDRCMIEQGGQIRTSKTSCCGFIVENPFFS